MNDRALTIRNDGSEIIRSVDDLLRLGDTLVKSGLLPTSIRTREAATAVILKGRELGIGAMEALSSINVIQGKPTVSPQLMLALARRTRELEDLQTGDDGQKCTVVVKRKGQSPHTTTFSMDDAKAMGLAGRDNWNKQPKVMRQWRALAANLRVTFSDAVSGLYTYEEMGAEVDEEGEFVRAPEILEVEPREEVVSQPTPEPASEGAVPTPLVKKPARDLKILIKPKAWNEFLQVVADESQFYMANGKPNPQTIVLQIKALGYGEITDENANEIRAALRAKAEEIGK